MHEREREPGKRMIFFTPIPPRLLPCPASVMRCVDTVLLEPRPLPYFFHKPHQHLILLRVQVAGQGLGAGIIFFTIADKEPLNLLENST